MTNWKSHLPELERVVKQTITMNNLDPLRLRNNMHIIESLDYLGDSQKLKLKMESDLESNPEFYGSRIKLLHEFLQKQKEPADIAIILYSGLALVHHLANYTDDHNLLFFRPLTSQIREVSESFLIGTPNPDRTLLLYETDMMSGNALKECRNYFEKIGYAKKNMYAYLFLGADRAEDISKGHINVPELDKIETILRNK